MKKINQLLFASLLFSFISTFLPQIIYSDSAHDFAQAANNSETFFTCPMHPEVKSKTPGECPICHMKLHKVEKIREEEKSTEKKKVKFYRNPMNPEITSPKPMKDDMGMDYVPVYEEDGVKDKLSDVPNRAAIQLNQTQFRLSGASITKAELRDIPSQIPAAGRALSQSTIILQVPEIDSSLLEPSLEVIAYSPSTGNEILKGKITRIDSTLDPMTRTIRVDVSLLQSHSRLKGEASVQGSIIKTVKTAVSVPQEAIMHNKNSDYVFILDEKRSLLIPKKVVIGARGNGFIEIKEGLSEGDQLSSGPNFLLDSESRIQVTHDQ